MKSIRNLLDRELKWVQPHALKMEYELRDGDDVVMTLRFRSMFGSLATAESADGCWTIKRVGFWQTRATIRASGDERDIAVFRNKTWAHGGTLELPDGRKYSANTNFWGTAFEFKTEAEEPLVKFRKIGGVLHSSAMVEIQSAGASLPELPWLVALGWYLAVMMQHDSAGAASAAAAAG